MRSGAGALKVEGSIAQEFNIALVISMVTKRAPTTQHCHSEEVQEQQQHQMLYLHDHKGITVLQKLFFFRLSLVSPRHKVLIEIATFITH